MTVLKVRSRYEMHTKGMITFRLYKIIILNDIREGIIYEIQR